MLNYEDFMKGEAAIPDEHRCYNVCRILAGRVGKELPSYEPGLGPSIIDSVVSDTKDLFQVIEAPEPYCIVDLRVSGIGGRHVGIVLEDGKHFLHVLNRKQGVTRQELEKWSHRIRGYYRYVG